MVSVSGIRGVVGKDLTPPVIVDYIGAFVGYVGAGTIVVGRDTRPSGVVIEDFVVSLLLSMGCDVIKLGVSSTPTVEMAVCNFKAKGGIIITASHNPIEWNALKFLDASGEFPCPEGVEIIKAKVKEKKFNYADHSKIGSLLKQREDADNFHLNKIFELDYINKNLISSKKFKIAFDPVNGAGINMFRYLFEAIDAQPFAVNNEPTGKFGRGAEPVPEALYDLCQVVKDNGCDIGFALDPDADRLALVDEKGVPLGEELTLALACDYVLSVKKSDIVTNLSSSMVLDDIAKKYSVNCYRSLVGERNVSMVMKEKGCNIGGEGNGGVIVADLHYGRDALVAAAIVLQLMAKTGKTVSQLKSEYNNYYMFKEKMALGSIDKEQLFRKMEREYSLAYSVDSRDGIKVLGDKWWLHVRASNTEPIIRVMIESPSEEQNKDIFNKFKTLL